MRTAFDRCFGQLPIAKIMRVWLLLPWAILGLSASGADIYRDWKLIWQDEFEDKTLDLSKWEFEVNAEGGGNSRYRSADQSDD